MSKKSMLKTAVRVYLLSAVLFLITVGCTLDPYFIPVAFIGGVPETGTAGIPLTLTGTVTPALANKNKIVWLVDDAGTTGAVIDGNILNTNAEGTATIIAIIPNGIAEGKDFTQNFSIEFRKKGDPVPVTGVSLIPSTLSMTAGDTDILTHDIKPDNATNKTVTWDTSDSSVVTVTNGKVTAIAAGTATITVTTVDGGKTATCVITVLAAVANEAKIGSTEYATLTEAIGAAESGTTGSPTEIVILRNIIAVQNGTNGYAYSIPDSKNIRLTVEAAADITITASAGNFRLFNIINAGSSLTLGPIDGGKLTLSGGNEEAASNRQGVFVNGSPTFTMNKGVTITGFNSTGNGGGVYANGSFTMNGGEISGNTAANGGGVYHAGGISNMKDGTISGNTANTGGGGVYIGSGTFNMSGGSIGETTANKNSAASGGGVYVTSNSATFNMSSGKISGNTATTNGGGVYNTNGIFNMSGGEISGNTAASFGGGVYSNYIFKMSGGEISGNTTTTSNGGGVYVTNDICEFTMNGGEIKDNIAKSGSTSSGGGVYLNSGKFNMSDTSKISGNTASRGGGVFVNGGTFEMKGGEISSGNNTTNSGGGVYVNSGTFNMNGSGTISGNTTTASGGGVYVGNATFDMSGGIISGNTATSGGGVYVGTSASGKFTMSGGYVYGTDGTGYTPPGTPNTATTSGASIFVAGTAKYAAPYGTDNITTTNDTLPDTLVLTTADELAAFLSGKAANTTDTSYKVKLNVNSTAEFNKINTVLQDTANQNKYVSLDLSGSTTITSVYFVDNDNLTSIIIPNSVTTIGFHECHSLISVTVPSSVTSIDSSNFSYCGSLTTINVDTANTVYSSQDGVLYDKNKTSLIKYPEGKTGSSFTIPNSVTTIGDCAFMECSSLTSVTMPNSVTAIGTSAFIGCTGLANINIPNSVTTIGDNAFAYCSLTSVIIPNSVTTIEQYTFNKCSSLTSVTIPNSVTTIEAGAFNDCNNLITVIFQGTITSGNFSSTSFPGDLRNKYLDDGGIGTYTRTSGGSTWTKQPFTSIEELGAYLASKPANTAATPYNVKLNVTGTLNNSIKTALNGKYVNLELTGNTLTSIGEEAFLNCSNLIGITIPNSVTSIGGYAFQNCTGLTNVIIPNNVTIIGEGAFWNCDITSVIIGSSVEIIGGSAFIGCNDLTTLIIPSSVTSIGEKAFQNCSSLTSVTFNGTITSLDATAFDRVGDLRDKYLAGGQGTYTAPTPGQYSVWTKQ